MNEKEILSRDQDHVRDVFKDTQDRVRDATNLCQRVYSVENTADACSLLVQLKKEWADMEMIQNDPESDTEALVGSLASACRLQVCVLLLSMYISDTEEKAK